MVRAVVITDGHPVTGDYKDLAVALSELGVTQIAKYEFPDMTGFADQVSLFETDGKVAVYVYAVIGTEVQGAGGLGPELVTNGGFTGDANGWTLGAGWAYNTNKVTHTPPDVENLAQVGPAPEPVINTYTLILTQVGGTAGAVDVNIYDGSSTTVNFDDTPFTTDIQSGGSGNLINIQPGMTYDGSIDNVSVKQVLTTTLTIGWDGDSESVRKFAEAFLSDTPLSSETLWFGGGMFAFNDPSVDVTPVFAPLDSVIIKMYVSGGGEVTQGGMIVYCMWYPLEDGATVTSLQET